MGRPQQKGALRLLFLTYASYTALVTFPERRQRVQTWTRQGVPSTSALTRRMLGFQERLVRRTEWDTLLPNEVLLSHTLHLANGFSSLPYITTIESIPDFPGKCKALCKKYGRLKKRGGRGIISGFKGGVSWPIIPSR